MKETIIHKVYAAKSNTNPYAVIAVSALGNQEPYFSITHISHGCDHDSILKKFPELQFLINLHLCGLDGAPLHAIENAFYWYAEGIHKDGRPYFYQKEEAKKAAQQQLEEEAFENYCQESGLEQKLSKDIWESVRNYTAYQSHYFNLALSYKNDIPTHYYTTPIVNRNNKALACHLRISYEEAVRIPSRLTKTEFARLYINPLRTRWQEEANSALKWIKKMEQESPPQPEDIEKNKIYYFGHAQFVKWQEKQQKKNSKKKNSL